MGSRTTSGTRRLVVAHPSTELYGADLQMLESVRAALAAGWTVTLVLPADGPLAERAHGLGADVVIASFPVLRKSLLSPRGLVGLAARSATALVRAARFLRSTHADVLYVSTVTIPVWLAAARLARVPSLCHVHEAEEDQPRAITAGLTAPLLLADALVANSAAAQRALGGAFPSLARRTTVVVNGVPGPPVDPSPREQDGPLRVVLVGRLSPRKGTDVAVEAVHRLVRDGYDVRLRLAGSVFEGYEWFEDDLRRRIAEHGLGDRVELLGFVHPVWDELERADVALVPSRVEPFGNAAVEALLAHRAVVASRVQGLAEIVRDHETGLLVPPDDPTALAAAVRALADDPDLRRRLAAQGRADALARFGTQRYGDAVASALDALAGPRVAADVS
ncbi:MAG: glycosyltransferase [Cellulomonas sp.]|uniref:Glycosyl transferase n=2 Tax=Cellulomonas TaxID=1707 RepID=A0A4Y3KMI9_9CELL|nr:MULTISPECIES: glycosyltransferase [Cellulomonas]MCR6649859.1 glycosyltransferase [Cellulomonas sp.]MCR6705750.1 glycosyltransferase [Cellulomonas sp.]GEA85093.1 glycosyl transferase [Cellulomonas gelida]GGL15208.1 glycosyl transferase [Cellulomonas gelida]